jgi:predicted RNA-binding Zn-ribbon protein involved in translation (DUF1610 family)
VGLSSGSLPLDNFFVVHLGSLCRCSCGTLSTPDLHTTIDVINCTIYFSNIAIGGKIQVYNCPSCDSKTHRKAGPDLGDFGFFNLNNSKIFAHELMHKYIADMSTSETPFAAFSNSVSCTYEEKCSPMPFVGQKDFERAFFGYIQLWPERREDFCCPECGSTPAMIIVDAITASYPKGWLTTDICPPTQITPISPAYGDVQSQPRLQVVTDSSLRGTSLDLITEIEDVLNISAKHVRIKSFRAFHKMNKKTLKDSVISLGHIDVHLGTLFQVHVAREPILDAMIQKHYLRLLRVVSV